MYHVLQPSNILRGIGPGVKLTVGTEEFEVASLQMSARRGDVFTHVGPPTSELLINRQVTVYQCIVYSQRYGYRYNKIPMVIIGATSDDH